MIGPCEVRGELELVARPSAALAGAELSVASARGLVSGNELKPLIMRGY